MAVQAQYPSNIPVADFCMSRAKQIYGNGNKNAFPYTPGSISFEDFQFQLMNNGSAAAATNQIALLNSVPGTSAIQQSALNGAQFTDEFICNVNVPNKRPRQSDYMPVVHHQQQQQQQIVQDFHRRPVSGPQNTPVVSTGLRLAFPDDRLSSTAPSTKFDLNSASLSLLNEEITMELQRQREEIEQLIRVQEEQMRRAIEEKQQQQSRALLGSLERFVARRLREKDLELEKMNRRNMELEERVKQLTVEARLWQSKAKNGEVMVANLRNNLQQAVALSREQSREGVGDTDADDAESSHPDDTADAHARTFKENKELREKRTCRVCRSNDVCILLLPCRHLCLCKECEARLDTCPLCRHSKSASVQVYMS